MLFITVDACCQAPFLFILSKLRLLVKAHKKHVAMKQAVKGFKSCLEKFKISSGEKLVVARVGEVKVGVQ